MKQAVEMHRSLVVRDYVVTYDCPPLWGSLLVRATDENAACLIACGYLVDCGIGIAQIESVERVKETA